MSAPATRTEHVPDNGLGASITAFAVLLAGAVVVAFIELGPLSAHMAAHIASMNVAAPLWAVLLRGRVPARWRNASAGLWLATMAQMALVWAAHAPAVHHAAQSWLPALLALHAALFLAALAFWMCIVTAVSTARWHAVLALLACGKLACLLGVLLIFAPRLLLSSPGVIYTMHHFGIDHGPADHAAALADQHLAGLLMVAACPLSYVLAAIVLVAQTMAGLERSALASGVRLGG